MRLFVAVEASDAWREAALAMQRALPRDVRDVLRMVAPELMHLTLRFLGEVDEEQVPALRDALGEHVPPVEVALSLGRAATFGPANRTSVVHLHVEGDRAALDALVERVDRAVAESLGVPREERAFNPHVTLARVTRHARTEERRRVAEAVRALAPPDPAPMIARRVALVRSHLGPRGPRYEVLLGVGEG